MPFRMLGIRVPSKVRHLHNALEVWWINYAIDPGEFNSTKKICLDILFVYVWLRVCPQLWNVCIECNCFGQLWSSMP